MNLNIYGFPVVDMRIRLDQAQAIADLARARNFPPDCECQACVNARNLPAVLRILAKWTPIGGA